MARFFGEVGFGVASEIAPGVIQEAVVKRNYSGDVVRDTVRFREGDKVNNDLSLGNSISIVSDAYAIEHMYAMRYVKWQGVLWVIINVELQSPRLLLRLGGVYNGITT